MKIKKIKMNDPETRSPDMIVENVAKLKELFPELITESKQGVSVNVDVLKGLVGDKTVSDIEEKYGLNWHGKRGEDYCRKDCPQCRCWDASGLSRAEDH